MAKGRLFRIEQSARCPLAVAETQSGDCLTFLPTSPGQGQFGVVMTAEMPIIPVCHFSGLWSGYPVLFPIERSISSGPDVDLSRTERVQTLPDSKI